MRNKQAARYARWSALVAVFLGVFVAGVYFHRAWQARLAEGEAPPAVPPSVQQQSAAFSFSKETGNHTLFTVRASHATQFSDGGRALLEDVWITVYGEASQRFDNLHTRSCDYVQSTGDITCKGEVGIDLESADDAKRFPGTVAKPNERASIMHVVTSHVVFNRQTGKASTDQRVVFRFPQGDGSGVGFLYDSDRGNLQLLHNVEMRFRQSAAQDTGVSNSATAISDRAPSATGSQTSQAPDALSLSGSSLLYNRDERVIRLSGPVKAQRGGEQLLAGLLNLELDENLRAKRIVASDHPELLHSAPAGPVSIAAGEFVAPIAADGWVERVIATGNVRADQRGPSGENHLAAARVEFELADRQTEPRHLRATGNVVVDSTGPAKGAGAGTTSHLATSQVDVDFTEGASKDSKGGRAHIASVTTPAATVDWTGSRPTSSPRGSEQSGGSGTSELQRIRVTAGNLAGTFGSGNEIEKLEGNGGVRTERQIGGAAPEVSTSREMSVQFEQGHTPAGTEWSSVNQSGDVRYRQNDETAQADRAHFDRSSDTVTLSGSVVLSDADSRTTAQAASFDHATSGIRAEGRVATIELASASGSVTNFAPGPARISGDQLEANTATNQAVYSGHARLWQGDSLLEADSIGLDRAARVLTAIGQVRGTFPQAAWRPAGEHAAGAGAPSSRQRNEFWRVEAGRMTYASNDSHARLEQGPKAHSDEGSIRADVMDLYFASSDPGASAGSSVGRSAGEEQPGSEAVSHGAGDQTRRVSNPDSSRTGNQQLDRAVAQGNVIVDEEDRHATGDRGEYTASEGKFVLSGGPPKVRDGLGNSSTGRQLTLFYADDKILIDSADGLRTLTMHQVEK